MKKSSSATEFKGQNTSTGTRGPVGGRRSTQKHKIHVLNIETLFQQRQKRGQRIITPLCLSTKEVIFNHLDLAPNPHFYSCCDSHLWVSHWPWRTGVPAGKRRRLWRWRGARWWDTPARNPSLSRRTRTNAWGKRKQHWCWSVRQDRSTSWNWITK